MLYEYHNNIDVLFSFKNFYSTWLSEEKPNRSSIIFVSANLFVFISSVTAANNALFIQD